MSHPSLLQLLRLRPIRYTFPLPGLLIAPNLLLLAHLPARLNNKPATLLLLPRGSVHPFGFVLDVARDAHLAIGAFLGVICQAGLILQAGGTYALASINDVPCLAEAFKLDLLLSGPGRDHYPVALRYDACHEPPDLGSPIQVPGEAPA